MSTLDMSVDGQMIFDGDVISDNIKKNNLNASVAPTATNDNTEGYTIGSFWVDTANDTFYICEDATTDNAVWFSTSMVTEDTLDSILQVENVTPVTLTPTSLNSVNINYYSLPGLIITFYFIDGTNQAVTISAGVDTQAALIADISSQLVGYTASALDAEQITITADEAGVKYTFVAYKRSNTNIAFDISNAVAGSGIPPSASEGQCFLLSSGANTDEVAKKLSSGFEYLPPVESALIYDKLYHQYLKYDDNGWSPLVRKSVRTINDSSVNLGSTYDNAVLRWDDEGNIVRYSITCFSGDRIFTLPAEFFDVESFEFFLQIDPAINGNIKLIKEGDSDYWWLPVDDEHGYWATYHIIIAGGELSINGKSNSEINSHVRHYLEGTNTRFYKDLAFFGQTYGINTTEYTSYLTLASNQNQWVSDSFTRASGEVWTVDISITGAVADESTGEVAAFATFRGTGHCSPVDGSFTGDITLVDQQALGGNTVTFSVPTLLFVSNDLRIQCGHQNSIATSTTVYWNAIADIRVISGASVEVPPS